MGAVGGLLGTAGGMGGTGFSANNGTTGTQLNNSYNQNQEAMKGQQNLLGALQAQNGLGNQSQVYGQLQDVVSGRGPNPAQAQLAQATGANVANQAALMAGQRGASANPALMARQAAQTGAGIQQNAAGQAATMQANQSLNAMTGAGNMANTMAQNQIGQVNQNVASAQNEQSILQGANTANNNIQGQLAGATMAGTQKLIGGAMNAGGAGAGQMKAEGGAISGAQSKFGQSLNKPMMASGGKVPAMVSPGEVFLEPQEAKAVAQGKANPLSVGEKIPGQPKYKGNDYRNDVVPKKLDAGGVVIPNKVLQSKDPVRGAAEFVRDVLAKKGKSA